MGVSETSLAHTPIGIIVSKFSAELAISVGKKISLKFAVLVNVKFGLQIFSSLEIPAKLSARCKSDTP